MPVTRYREETLEEGDVGYFRPVPFSEDDSHCCNATGFGLLSKKHFYCTRPKGHTGPHAAHGAGLRQYATWEGSDAN